MTPDTLAIAGTIVGTGIALAALNVGLFAWLRTDMHQLQSGQTRLEDRMSAVEKEQARTSGLLEGLGLVGRATPAPEPS